jgi:hypothetical protein
MKVFCIAIFMISAIHLSAQVAPNFSCQTQRTDEMTERLTRFTAQYYNEGNLRIQETAPTLKHVSITVHLVANDDGTQHLDGAIVLDMICELNERMAHANLYFLLNDINYINNSSYGQDRTSTRVTMSNRHNVENSLNVYILGNVPAPEICGLFSGYSVVLTNDCADAFILAHEIGHYLSLQHTFYEWEGKSGNIGNAPNWAERVDGSNCSTAGDQICDTPPDYLFGRWSSDSCSISGTVNVSDNGELKRVDLIDPTGVSFEVEGNNIMSYGSQSCLVEFTTDQIAAMHFYIENYKSGYVIADQTISIIDTASIPNTSIDEEGLPFDVVDINWEAVLNATKYLVELNTSFFFGINTMIEQQVVSSNTARFLDLEPGETYYWKITPFNSSYTCSPSGPINGFKTGLFASTGLEGIRLFTVFPNPITSDNTLATRIYATEATDAEFVLYNASGQVVLRFQETLSKGTNEIPIPHQKLMNGVYLLSLITSKGQVTQRVMVVD